MYFSKLLFTVSKLLKKFKFPNLKSLQKPCYVKKLLDIFVMDFVRQHLIKRYNKYDDEHQIFVFFSKKYIF